MWLCFGGRGKQSLMGRDKDMPVVALLSGMPTVCLQMWLFLMRSAGSCDLHPPEADHKSNHKGTVGSSPTLRDRVSKKHSPVDPAQ